MNHRHRTVASNRDSSGVHPQGLTTHNSYPDFIGLRKNAALIHGPRTVVTIQDPVQLNPRRTRDSESQEINQLGVSIKSVDVRREE